ncbi:diguanylate cyclase [Halomonas sp. ML-15]|uniref:diguanylate cyclase n=1 Tax=Halomonas sp. ML-15 TaxID=2773305 RepID=UPI001747D52A|nr:diguanylate cyclase [Halomonas sp. ML-15]MBD3894509.1 diguanylate cyclase [Halomonas sp. ML-15]
MPSQQEQALLDASEHYFEVFFVQRDATGAAALATDAITGFGTGVDESVYDIDYALYLYQRDIEAMPSPVHYTLKQRKAIPLSDSLGLVMGECDWHLTIHQQSVTMRQVRFTLLMRWLDGGWKVEHKHLSQPSPAHGDDEPYPLKQLEERAVVLERLVKQRTQELESAHRQLHQMAITDPLTGLFNRIKTDEVLEEELVRQTRTPLPLSLILIDIDHFKPINDDYGHHKGDEVLIDVAQLLQQRKRITDCLSRWGGEEFLFICPNTTHQDAYVLADSVREAIAAHTFSIERRVTFSAGVASYRPGDDRNALMERADRAMYAAKQAGRNRVISENV